MDWLHYVTLFIGGMVGGACLAQAGNVRTAAWWLAVLFFAWGGVGLPAVKIAMKWGVIG